MIYRVSGGPRLDHVQIAAPSGCESEARRFFGELIGLAEVEKPEPLRQRGGVWFELGEQQLHVGVKDDFSPAHKAHPALRVSQSELDAIASRLTAPAPRWIGTTPCPDPAASTPPTPGAIASRSSQRSPDHSPVGADLDGRNPPPGGPRSARVSPALGSLVDHVHHLNRRDSLDLHRLTPSPGSTRRQPPGERAMVSRFRASFIS